MCVATITSPASGSPLMAMRLSLRATDHHQGSSPSDTKPIRLGRAPTPPESTSMPSLGASPPARLPRVPRMSAWTKSVDRCSPCTRLEVKLGQAGGAERLRHARATRPSAVEQIHCLEDLLPEHVFLATDAAGPGPGGDRLS